jgi:hypothetical protein
MVVVYWNFPREFKKIPSFPIEIPTYFIYNTSLSFFYGNE